MREVQRMEETQLKAGKRKRHHFIAVLIIFPVLMLFGLFYLFIYRVEPSFSEVTYELGERVSRDPGDYLKGSTWSVNLGEVDVSGVDSKNTGIYETVVRHGIREYHFTVVIEDTIAPEIVCRDSQVYLAAGRNCCIEDVISEIRDNNAVTDVFFYDHGEEKETISFREPGEYTVEVLARDGAGNKSVAGIPVIVDTAPAIEGNLDFYVTLESSPDYLAGVTASDETDGTLTDCISVDDSLVNLSEEGEYVLSYSVRDSFGLVTTEESKIVVLSEERLQELIGKRQIDRNSLHVLGAANPYDGGAGEEDNLAYELDYLRPAMVQLYHETYKGYSAGSGYIMEITDDYIYLCTNEHVIHEHDRWDVYFYDGTKAEGKKLGTSDAYDVGVVVVRREDIPSELMEQLMTVHIDKTYWETLDEDDIELGLARVDRQGGIVHTSQGWLIKIKQQFEWERGNRHTEITVKLVHGDSGSAILDGHGNLIAMAYAYTGSPTRYWCVPLDAILDCYTEITGRTPFVY